MNKSSLKMVVRIFAGIAIISPHASAVTFSVNSTVDSIDANPGDGVCETSIANECTLRAAVQESNALPGADTIIISSGSYVLTISGRSEDASLTGDIDITDDVSILGIDASNTIVDANNIDRIFDVFAPANVVIEDISVQNGDIALTGALGEHGGGIRNQGTLSLNEVIVVGNTAGDFGIGGGIFNVGTLNLLDVSISGNFANHTGGVGNFGDGNATLTNVTISNNTSIIGTAGMQNGEGISGLSPTAILTNVTISGNVGGGCTGCGGGFGNEDSATLTNVTITENTGFAGAGIFIGYAGPDPQPSTQLKNTIVANNIGRNCSSTFTPILSLGHNLSSDDTCNLTEPSDLINTDPLFGPLQDNGGFTQTHALLAGSPAIDNGSIDCPPPLTDQRGEQRAVDGNNDGFVACDIGSYEVQPPATIIVTIDILPKSEVNTINLNNRGNIKVAILSTSEFLAYNEVNTDSVTFGPAGAYATRYKMKDVNRDGLLDILFYFKIKETGIICGDTAATLTGETFDGQAIEGSDSIVTKGCGQ